MIARLGSASASLARRFLPDPFVFAILLTFVTYAMGIALTRSGPVEMVRHWAGGFWDLLTFGMQMTLILVTGHALASSKPVKRLVVSAARWPRTTAQAASVTALLSMVAGLINWGLGLIFGALLAREIGLSAKARGVSLHYPLVVAGGYSGLLIWHGGLSGSAPFVVATEGHFLQGQMGLVPVMATIGSSLNLVVTVLLLIFVPLIYVLLARGVPAAAESHEGPDDPGGLEGVDESVRRALIPIHREQGEDTGRGRATPQGQTVGPDALSADGDADARGERRTRRGVPPGGHDTWGRRLDQSRVLAIALVLMAAVYLFIHFRERGLLRGLDLNVINFCFLFLGLLLHGSPIAYVRAVGEGVKGASGIILQFPFYAGIMGMMKDSGLVGVISDWFVSLSKLASQAGVSTDACLPIMTFLSAGIVNFFVPSGGGQWAVQGPIAVGAAGALNVPVEKIVMAVAYGDEWTNMLQPFWALALLGITGLRARDIIGYTAVVMILVLPLYLLALAVF